MNEGRPDRGNVWGATAREEVKLSGLKGLGMKIIMGYLKRVHWRFLPRNVKTVDMRVWCAGGGQWNMATGGWRVEREVRWGNLKIYIIYYQTTFGLASAVARILQSI